MLTDAREAPRNASAAPGSTWTTLPEAPALGERCANGVGETGRVVSVATDGRDVCRVAWDGAWGSALAQRSALRRMVPGHVPTWVGLGSAPWPPGFDPA